MAKAVRYLIVGFVLLGCTISSAQIRIVNGDGASIDDLIRQRAIVTIVLKGRARDPNNRLTGLHRDKGTLTFETATGQNLAYKISKISEIRVQDARIDTSRRPKSLGILTKDDLEMVDRASDRALQIFKQSSGNQMLKMSAAMALAASTHHSKRSAKNYLGELASSNDLRTSLMATMFLYFAGVDPNPDVLQEGFLSGNREARVFAATLTGMTNNKDFLPEVRTMLHDPTVELFAAAAIALARMDDRSSIPELFEAIKALREEKADAAVYALSRIDGDDVREKMQELLETSKGLEWFRVVQVLHALGDEHATQLLKKKGLAQPAYQRRAAIVLAESGDRDALLFLRNYLRKPADPNLENLMYRVEVGAALFEAGEPEARRVLQELLSIEGNKIYARGHTADKEYKQATAAAVQATVCLYIGYSRNKRLLPMLAGPIQSPNPGVAVEACIAAQAIANTEFGVRRKEALE